MPRRYNSPSDTDSNTTTLPKMTTAITAGVPKSLPEEGPLGGPPGAAGNITLEKPVAPTADAIVEGLSVASVCDARDAVVPVNSNVTMLSVVDKTSIDTAYPSSPLNPASMVLVDGTTPLYTRMNVTAVSGVPAGTGVDGVVDVGGGVGDEVPVGVTVTVGVGVGGDPDVAAVADDVGDAPGVEVARGDAVVGAADDEGVAVIGAAVVVVVYGVVEGVVVPQVVTGPQR